MQILLTQKEYDKLTKAAELGKDMPNAKQVQELCTEVANHKPVEWGWGSEDPKPWGCILTANHEWYCDQCPVEEVCPYENKGFSK